MILTRKFDILIHKFKNGSEKVLKSNKKTKENKKKKGKIKKVLLLILLILIILIGVFAYKVHKNGGGSSGMIATILGHDEETVNKLPKLYCLLLGKSQNLTDTLILASYDPKTQEAAMLSIPRDTFIGESKSSATAWDKINAVYQTGAENVLEDVRNLTGIDVKYYVMVDTEALKVLVDKIGGVTFNVPIDMKYDDRKQNLHINLKAGEQLLDGDKAEQVVRFRHNNNGSTYPESYGIEDIGRMRTQRAFLTALAKQTLVPANITKIPDFIDIAKNYVETNLDFDAIKDYVPYAINFNMDNLKTDKLPGIAEVANGVWIYSAYEEETKKVVNELFYTRTNTNTENNGEDGNTISNTTTFESASPTAKSVDKSKINIEVLNGSGNNTNLKEVVAELKAAGYNVNKTGKTTTTSITTAIDRKVIADEIKEDIKNIIDTDNITTGQESGNTHVTIILGTDYVS